MNDALFEAHNGISFLFSGLAAYKKCQNISKLLQLLDSETTDIVTETWINDERLNITLIAEHNFIHKKSSHHHTVAANDGGVARWILRKIEV